MATKKTTKTVPNLSPVSNAKYTVAKYPTAPKLTSPTYTAPQYNDSKYKKGVDTSFYTNAIKQYTTQANKQRNTQISEAGASRDTALKNAYITRAQNENKLNERLAMTGIRGGASETASLGLQNTYGTAVNAANSDYTNAVKSINQSADQNIADYTSDMNSRAEEYRQNIAQAKWQADRETALSKWEAARSDALTRYNASREDAINRWNAANEANKANYSASREDALTTYNAINEYWNNYYVDIYAGYSKKRLKKAEKYVKKQLDNAKTPAAKIRWQQALRGIGARRGVIANSK